MPTQPEETPYEYEVLDRPGVQLSSESRRSLVQELKGLASHCLDPLPNYQCLSFPPDALNDKLIVIARDASNPPRIVAFVSCVYLTIPAVDGPGDFTVLHTGLTCIAPEVQRTGLTVGLFTHVFMYMINLHPEGFWVTSLAEVPSSLVSISRYVSQVFPAPRNPMPSPMQLHIAETISRRYREHLNISPDAVFDHNTFVFRGSNPPSSCFRKDSGDERYQHRSQNEANEFYQRLLGRNEGNEVLQVGYFELERVMEAKNSEKRFSRLEVPGKTKL